MDSVPPTTMFGRDQALLGDSSFRMECHLRRMLFCAHDVGLLEGLSMQYVRRQ